jgi:hypothetical protein
MYLSDDNNIEYVTKATGLSIDELEYIAGRFDKKHHSWPKKLKGVYEENWDGEKKILHHFTRKLLWKDI